MNKETAHTEYIFIDESGDLGKHGSKYFTIAAVATHEPIQLARIIKRLRERKLKKKLKELPEIKANNSNKNIREFVLKKIDTCDCSISAIAIPKTNIKDAFFDDKEKLYNYLCGLLFEHISLNAKVVNITIDKKHSNYLLREDFNQYVESKIRSRINDISVKIKHSESHSLSELQAIDFVAWAVNRKFTHGDSVYYDIIKDKIRNQGTEEIKL